MAVHEPCFDHYQSKSIRVVSSLGNYFSIKIKHKPLLSWKPIYPEYSAIQLLLALTTTTMQ